MTKISEISQAGIDFIVKHEGCILHPYKDSGGVWTIGIGTIHYESGARVTEHDPPISKERAYQLFRNVVKPTVTFVDAITRDDINQNQFDSLVSFAYNVGTNALKTSTLLKKVNANPNDPSIKQEFEKWCFDNGHKVQGLLQRRIDEANLYFS